MQTCFEILGIKPDATQKELKRAYFSLVRLHSPEKEPELFQTIRSAYEEATKAIAQDIPVFAHSDSPREKAAEDLLTFSLEKDAEEILSACKAGLLRHPRNQYLLYHQCRALRETGRGTAAIKSAEKLLKQSPDNRHYLMELALCYIREKWYKKAQDVCEKIMANGCRNVEFLLGYSSLLKQYKKYDEIYTILYKIISENDTPDAERLSKLMDACVELICASSFLEDKDKQSAAIQLSVEFLKPNRSLLGKEPIAAFCNKLRAAMKDGSAKQIRVYQNAVTAVQGLASPGSEAGKIASIIGSFELDKLNADRRLPRCAAVLYRAYMMTPSLHPNAVKMDARLCGIMEREALLACKPVLKLEYPEFYSRIVTFLRAISTEQKAAALREELQSKYQTYNYGYFPERKRYFYEFYPDQKPRWMDEVEFELDDEEDDVLLEILRRMHGRGFPF